MGSLEKFWKKWITGEVERYYGIESSPVIHFSIVYVAPSPAIHFTTGLFTKKNFSAHKSKVVRDKKLGNMSPQANHFISKNSRIIQNNPGEKIRAISFKGYIRSEMPFWRQNMKIGCLEHVWVPSVLRRKSRTYPLKIALKNFGWIFLAFFAPIWKHLITNTLPNEILEKLRPRALYRVIRDTQERLPDMLIWAVFDQNQAETAKNALENAFYFCMFDK